MSSVVEEKDVIQNSDLNLDGGLESIENTYRQIIDQDFKKFEEKFIAEMKLQRQSGIEDREFERKKFEEEKDFQHKNIRIERWWKIFGLILAVSGFYRKRLGNSIF